jgi:co-chaperonin GroES (HSP10)
MTTDSGLLLSEADANSFRYKKGKVVKPGTAVDVINIGDEILYDKKSGYDMIIDQQTYTIILEKDVVVVL